MAIGPHAEAEAEVLEKHPVAGPPGRVAVALLTPRGSVAEREADEVIAPGVEGEFGVLAGHVAFLSALRPGVLTIRDGGTREVFAVGKGYLEVGAGGATRVLVDDAVRAADVRVDEVREELSSLSEQLEGAADAGAAALLRARLAWAQARLAAHAVAGRS